MRIVRKCFNDSDLKVAAIHWNGKLLLAVASKDMVGRLPIIITSGDMEQILKIPELQDTNGKELATTIYETLQELGLTETVKAICCDTTTVNLGHKNGASILLEEMLERKLLNLP